jgi:hypothetical protein
MLFAAVVLCVVLVVSVGEQFPVMLATIVAVSRNFLLVVEQRKERHPEETELEQLVVGQAGLLATQGQPAVVDLRVK